MRTVLWLSLLVAAASARTVRVRPVATPLDQDTRQAEYYAEQPEEDDGPILVSRQDTYGRATGQARINPRFKPETARQPPVQTIRNYNKLNDDGSFTFGYEAADGSFKEETRGTDCVVRGKYGYVDPDGNKREFTYVSGNPCDPNAVNQEEEEERPLLENGEENIPANIPSRRPVRPRPQSNPTTLYQQNYNIGSSQEEEEEEENIPVRIPSRPPSRSRPVTTTYRPSYVQSTTDEQTLFRASPSPTPKAAFIPQPTPKPQSVRITPRPSSVEPATTYRPQLLEVTASPAPTPTRSFPKPRPTQSSTGLSFDDEFKKFQLENNVVSTTSKPSKGVTSDPIYSTELVFDPSSGQYNTVLYQALPQTVGGEVNLRGRLQPYVDNPFPSNPFQPNPFSAPQRPLPYQQQLFQQNQAQLLQQSQQLFAQQQKRQKPVASAARLENPRQVAQGGFPASLLQQEPQTFQPQQSRAQAFSPQPFYYVNPQAGSNNLAAGQIDAFLRGQSLAV